jgi:hypothetical protein
VVIAAGALASATGMALLTIATASPQLAVVLLQQDGGRASSQPAVCRRSRSDLPDSIWKGAVALALGAEATASAAAAAGTEAYVYLIYNPV